MDYEVDEKELEDEESDQQSDEKEEEEGKDDTETESDTSGSDTEGELFSYYFYPMALFLQIILLGMWLIFSTIYFCSILFSQNAFLFIWCV